MCNFPMGSLPLQGQAWTMTVLVFNLFSTSSEHEMRPLRNVLELQGIRNTEKKSGAKTAPSWSRFEKRCHLGGWLNHHNGLHNNVSLSQIL